LIPEAGDRLPAIRERLIRFALAKPANPLGHFLLALAGVDQEAHLRKALAADSAFWPAHFEWGRMLRVNGDRDAAIAEFASTLRLHPTHEGAHFALSSLYAEAGDREKSKFHREAHHQLRAQAAEAEQKRSAAAPRLQVTVR
jgi:tetratricopeptide (TPR) repeat protein